jgi:hypothetical protein
MHLPLAVMNRQQLRRSIVAAVRYCLLACSSGKMIWVLTLVLRCAHCCDAANCSLGVVMVELLMGTVTTVG